MDTQDYLELVLATAQAGLTYSRDPFDIERFRVLQDATAALLAQGDETLRGNLQALVSGDVGYPTPKIDVRAFVCRDGEVLLVRERTDGLWTLPGGWCDLGQSPRECVEREVAEETGLRCTALRLLALLDKKKHPHPRQIPHAYKAFFHCRIDGGGLLQETNETTGAGYFPLDALPDLSLGRVLPDQIQLMARLAAQPAAPTLFD